MSGPVTEMPAKTQTPFLRLSANVVQLTRPNGSIVWTVPMVSIQPADLVAEGDFTGDGVPDYVLLEVRFAVPAQTCGAQPLGETQLVFVNGATGAYSKPVPATPDRCWPNLGYATHHWGIGTTYVGHCLSGVPVSQVVVFPFYATSGQVLRYTARTGWRQVTGAVAELAFPSSAAFDSVYDANNASPWTVTNDYGTCYVENSHVPNAIFIGTGGSTTGLFVLTSSRALIYRPDLTPTSDFVWSYAEGNGRNYGLIESHQVDTGLMVTLVGGCSTAKTRDSMRTGALSTDPCGLQHHYEWFLVKGTSIVDHAGRFYGWAGSDGLWQNRLEFPFPSEVPLAGTSLWSVFNLYRDGEWRIQLLPNPVDPNHVIEAPGWYVWGSAYDPSGQLLLAATRTPATESTDVASYIPPWEFDLLRWSDGALVSVAHHVGVVPSLILYPPGPGYHVSDGDTFGLFAVPARNGGSNKLLVEAPDGSQQYVNIPDSQGSTPHR